MKTLSGLLILVLSACAQSGEHLPVNSAAVQKNAVGGVSYSKDAKPIFEKFCKECHPSQHAPDWMDYNQAKAFAVSGDLFRVIMVERSMPLKGSPQAAAITERERGILAAWAKAGGPLDAAAPAQEAGGGGRNGSAGQEGPAVVQSCLGCHGNAGAPLANNSEVPRLAGQREEYLFAQLMKFREWKRVDWTQKKMNDIASPQNLSEEQLHEAAHYFATAAPNLNAQPVQMDSRLSPEFTLGQSRAANECISCHMNPDYRGESTYPLIPRLAGQSSMYVFNQLRRYHDGLRIGIPMNDATQKLGDAEMHALALYFSLVR